LRDGRKKRVTQNHLLEMAMANDALDAIRDVALATVLNVQLGLWDLQQRGSIATSVQIDEPRMRAILQLMMKRGVIPSREREEVIVCLRALGVPKRIRVEVWGLLEDLWQESATKR
jgi:hypothetical protein